MITKVSEITVDEIKTYLRISEISDKDEKYLETMKKIIIDYIKNNTGLEDDDMDKYSDLVAVFYVLCQDLYDTRSYYVDNNNVNVMVQSILNMHSRNLL
jgi:hypothetical protein